MKTAKEVYEIIKSQIQDTYIDECSCFQGQLANGRFYCTDLSKEGDCTVVGSRDKNGDIKILSVYTRKNYGSN